MMAIRETLARQGRYAACLVAEVEGSRWYIWDLRSSDPWWLPAAKHDDAPDLTARIVLDRFLVCFADEETITEEHPCTP